MTTLVRFRNILQPHPLHPSPHCTAATRAPFLVLHRPIIRNQKLALVRWFRIPSPVARENHLCVGMFSGRMLPWQRLRTFPPHLHGHSKRRDETRPLRILSFLLAQVPENGMALWISVNRHPPSHAPRARPDHPIPRGTLLPMAITQTHQTTYSRQGCRLR
jgi:hypothetical protein